MGAGRRSIRRLWLPARRSLRGVTVAGLLEYRFALRPTSEELVHVTSGEVLVAFRLAGSAFASWTT